MGQHLVGWPGQPRQPAADSFADAFRDAEAGDVAAIRPAMVFAEDRARFANCAESRRQTAHCLRSRDGSRAPGPIRPRRAWRADAVASATTPRSSSPRSGIRSNPFSRRRSASASVNGWVRDSSESRYVPIIIIRVGAPDRTICLSNSNSGAPALLAPKKSEQRSRRNLGGQRYWTFRMFERFARDFARRQRFRQALERQLANRGEVVATAARQTSQHLRDQDLSRRDAAHRRAASITRGP